jgi:hypothetical protein
MAAVGYFQLGEAVEENIVKSLCKGGVGFNILKKYCRYLNPFQ